MSATLNQQKSNTLLSNTIQNPKNNDHCLAINTCSDKDTIDPPVLVVDKPKTDSANIDKAPKAESEKLKGVDHSDEKEKGKGKVHKPILKTIT